MGGLDWVSKISRCRLGAAQEAWEITSCFRGVSCVVDLDKSRRARELEILSIPVPPY